MADANEVRSMSIPRVSPEGGNAARFGNFSFGTVVLVHVLAIDTLEIKTLAGVGQLNLPVGQQLSAPDSAKRC